MKELGAPKPPSYHRTGFQPAPRDPYTAFALRWWWLILSFTAFGLLAGVLYLRFGPIPYTSSAIVMVPPQTDLTNDSLGSPSKVNATAESYAAQAASAPIYENVSRAISGTQSLTPTQISQMVQEKRIDIRATRGTNLITILVTDRDPAFAEQLADTYSDVFVEQVNSKARDALAERRKDLEARIDSTQQQLTASQLSQRRDDLQKELQQHRAMLLQLQMQYQQEIQRQAVLDRLEQVNAPQAGGTNAPTDEIQQFDDSSDQARALMLASLAEQQKNEEEAIGRISTQLAQVRDEAQRTQNELAAQLAQVRSELGSTGPRAASADESAMSDVSSLQQQALEAEAGIAALQQQLRETEATGRDEQAQRSQLQTREQGLIAQVQNAQNAIQGFEAQVQQERARQVQIRQQANAGPIPLDSMPKDQRRAIEQQRANARRSAEAMLGVSEDTIRTLEQRKSEAERRISTTLRELSQVREQLATLPPARSSSAVTELQRQVSSLEQRSRALQLQLRDAQAASQSGASQRTQLLAREQDLQRQIRESRSQLLQREQAMAGDEQGRRARLLQLQANYQQEVQRQAEADKREAVAELQRQTSTGVQVPSATTNPQLAAASSELHVQWMQAIGAQIKDVEGNIKRTSTLLEQVRESLSKYPQMTDPAVSAMFVGAYSQMLQDLTRDYVRLQLNAQNTTAPIIRFGGASDALQAGGLRKILLIAVGGGFAAGVVLSYGLQLMEQRRQAMLQFEETRRNPPEIAAPPHTAKSGVRRMLARATGRRYAPRASV